MAMSPSSSHGGGESAVQVASVAVTSVEILALTISAGPTIVAAPGIGKYVLPLKPAIAVFLPGVTPYAGGAAGNRLSLKTFDGSPEALWLSTATVINTPIKGATSNVLTLDGGDVNTSIGADSMTHFENLPLKLFLDGTGTAYTAGNGTLLVSVAYTTVTFA